MPTYIAEVEALPLGEEDMRLLKRFSWIIAGNSYHNVYTELLTRVRDMRARVVKHSIEVYGGNVPVTPPPVALPPPPVRETPVDVFSDYRHFTLVTRAPKSVDTEWPTPPSTQSRYNSQWRSDDYASYT
jgi:hypothetical protein